MPETLISYDFSKPPEEQEIKPHNRWHPDIPMAVRVKPGDEFRLQCFDWTGGQGRTTTAPTTSATWT